MTYDKKIAWKSKWKRKNKYSSIFNIKIKNPGNFLRDSFGDFLGKFVLHTL